MGRVTATPAFRETIVIGLQDSELPPAEHSGKAALCLYL